MKRSRWSLLGVALLASACADGGRPSANLADEQRAILAQGESMLAAENARDFDTSLGMYTEDAVIHGPGMPVLRGRETIRTMYQQLSAPGMPRTSGAFTERHVTVAGSGDLAWEESEATTTIETPAGPVIEPGKQLIVWKKVDGTWQVAAVAWSGNSPPKPSSETPRQDR